MPPPPQADGKNMPSLLKVFKSVEPPSTSISFSPFIEILTFPAGINFDFTNNNTLTNEKITVRKIATLETIVVVLKLKIMY